MDTVWIVMRGYLCGTTEILSVWSTREGAEKEAERIEQIFAIDVDVYPEPIDTKWEGL